MMKIYKLLFFLNFTLLFIGCNGQENPHYIGKKFGIFDLDKVTFEENVDSLFSKVNKNDLILIVGKDSYFDTIQKKKFTPTQLNMYIEFRTQKLRIYILLRLLK